MGKRGTSGKAGGIASVLILTLLLTVVGAGAGFCVSLFLGDDLPERKMARADAVSPQADKKHAQPEGAASPEAKNSHEQNAPAVDTAVLEHDKAEDLDKEDDIDPKTVKPVHFPPVLTTLASPPGTWIRLEGSALVAEETEESPELLAERAGDQVFAYLHTVQLEQIEGPSGMLGLRRDLNDTVRVLSDGQVQGILIHGLVVE